MFFIVFILGPEELTLPQSANHEGEYDKPHENNAAGEDSAHRLQGCTVESLAELLRGGNLGNSQPFGREKCGRGVSTRL